MMRKSYKFRLYPNREQITKLQGSLDLCRELYNAALQERRDAWHLNRVNISFYEQGRQITEIRQLRPEYCHIQSRVCREVLRQVDRAFQAFFRRIKSGNKPGYPRFKGANFFNSFVYNREGFRFFGNKLRLANIGLVKVKLHRTIEGTIKEVVIKREGVKWYAIASCAEIPANPLPNTGNQTGIDIGIENFATLSDGTQIENWKYYTSTAKKLRVAQRRVSRRKKGSNRRRKAVTVLRSIHQKIFNQRSDFQHKLSRHLVNEFDLIAIEKLNIKGMSRGILSKQIHDASWSSFFHKLAYKAESAGRKLVEVDPRNTSQTCTCGAVVKKDLSVRWHDCSECGLSNHRDIVSAQNILKLGLGFSLQDKTWAVTPCVS